MNPNPRSDAAIAIIGMAGRFPKAKDIHQFWRNLCAGVEGISFFTDEDLASVTLPKSDPAYVKARGVLEEAELFDAGYFSIQPKEAELMDPQQRVFLECAVEALDDAGCDPHRYPGAIGVFAGVSMNTYLTHHVLSRPDIVAQAGEYPVMLANDKDFLTTRVSYKLNLRGPSLNIQTACSTSLVAVAVACQNLLHYACDAALAGAVSIGFPQRRGYWYQEGGITSPDGHCRAFDEKAAGTVAGEGVGIVVLKRLDEALAEGDQIYAVIRGFALNNDGAGKVGYTAPSVEGQAEVIQLAQAMAEIEPESVGYIEAHGTGTPLGDPVEIAGLTEAFAAGNALAGSCAIGSVKSNIGHLDVAAGIAGLIKTVLALRHGQIPGTLHFQALNPKIDFARSPFHVSGQLRAWPSGKTPRRAGVSSFGIGGTNAHVVLEEAPTVEAGSPSRPCQLIMLSARSEPALIQAADNLAAHLRLTPVELQPVLADVACTLQTGRREFNHRLITVCETVEETAQQLAQRDPKRVLVQAASGPPPAVVFMFPGQGAQQANMGLGLYRTEPAFREQIDYGCDLLESTLALDLRSAVFPSQGAGPSLLASARWAQPALFLIEHALAKLWMSWGVTPEAMIGHSVGEYVAACLAGVLSFEEAILLVARRAQLVQELEGGAMLAVRLPEDEMRSMLGANLSLAAVNGPSLSVVSGPATAVESLRQDLEQRSIASRTLPSSHAFHSAMLEPALPAFRDLMTKARLREPALPYLSNVTGSWIKPEEATDPDYWVRHLRSTVRFADGLRVLAGRPDRLFLEVGPGQALAPLVRQQVAGSRAVSSLPRVSSATEEPAHLLTALGQLWLAGATIDWLEFHGNERRKRVSLPAYPLERKRYWIEPGSNALNGGALRTPTANELPPDLSPEALRPAATKAETGAPKVRRILALLEELSGQSLAPSDAERTFVQLGFDSLFLSQFSLVLEKRLGLRLAFRQLLEEFSTPAALAERLEASASPPVPVVEPAARMELGTRQFKALPLTEAQREIWFNCQVSDEAAVAFHESVVIRFRGMLAVERLVQSIQQAVDRHESLRSTIDPAGCEQRIHPAMAIQVPLHELPVGTGEESLQSTLEAEARTPFDLAEGPLIRASVWRGEAGSQLLLVTAHHLICDGPSLATIVREVCAGCVDGRGTGKSTNAQPPLQWSNYNRQQERGPDARDYWRRQFADGGPVLELPADKPRPPVRSFAGGRAVITLKADLAADLRRVARESDCTLFTLLLASCATLLHRLTSQDDLVVGVPAAARAEPGADRLVGHCVQFLPLRFQFEPGLSFLSLTRRVKQMFLEGRAQGHCAVSELAGDLGFARDATRRPLASASFNLIPFHPRLSFPGLVAEVEPGPAPGAHFDLGFNVGESESELRVEARFASALFEPGTVRRWLGHWENLLRGIVAAPNQGLGSLRLLSGDEERQLLEQWNRVEVYPPGPTLVQWFEAQAAARSDATAVTAEIQQLSYGELNERANQLAGYLRRRGVGPEILVGLFVERSADLAVAILGILKAGGAYLPLDPAYPRERLAFMLEDAQVPVILSHEPLRAGLPETAAEVISLDGDWERIDLEPKTNLGVRIDPQNLAYVIYTSGSTGRPKGTLVTHHNVVRLFQSSQAWFGFDERDVWTLFHSTAFDFSVWEFWGALLFGGRLVVVSYFVSRSAPAFLQLLRHEGVTVLNQTPSAFRELDAADEARGERSELALRYVIFGGEALEPRTLERWFARHGDERPRLINMYGITETTVHVTYRPLTRADRSRGSVIGGPLPDLSLRVLDPYGQIAPIGVPGELCVGGDGLARGYLNRTELTAERFVADRLLPGAEVRLYRSGDRARFLPGHDIEYLGRLDQQIKIRGFRIELGEIEAALARHPGVREGVVLSRPDSGGAPRLVAYVVALAGSPPSAKELRACLQASLPDYMVPSVFVFLESFPLTAHGKLDRRALPEPDPARTDGGEDYVAPASPAEEVLAETWRELLRLDRVGTGENFFALGGHSLLAAQFIARVRESFGVDLPIRAVFETPTIAALALVVEGLLADEIDQLTEERARELVR